MGLQAENVGGAVKPAKAEKLSDRFDPQPFDVERPAAYKVLQTLDALGGADQTAGAANIDFVLLAHRVRLAFGAHAGEDESRPQGFRRQVFKHLRDNITRALDADSVADADTQPRDLICIVQRRIGDDDTTDRDRLEPRNRGQLAGTPHLNVDREQSRLRALGRKFMRDGPARCLGNEPQSRLPVEPIHFVDNTVDIERQVSPRCLYAAILQEDCWQAVGADQSVADGHAPALDNLHDLMLRDAGDCGHFAPSVGEKA